MAKTSTKKKDKAAAKQRGATDGTSVGLDERVVRAISHPLRHRLLVLLNERVASPNELARELGEPLGTVSYHVLRLRDAGAIELVRTEPRRGAVEHYYRAIARAWFSDDDWARLPKLTRRTIFGQHLARIAADVVAAAEHDGFDHPEAHVSFTHFELDAAGITAMSALLSETLERALQIQAESVNRGEAEAVATELAILHFERAPAKRRKAAPRKRA
jgi:DNA-binding transcriptional ArsR family regulator